MARYTVPYAIGGSVKTLEASGIPQVDAFRRELDEGWRATEHAYVVLLGLKTQDARRLHTKLEEGLSYATLERLQRVLNLPTSRLCELLRIPARTLARRRASKRLQPDESDRLVRLARLVGMTLQLFEGDLAESRSWLTAPQRALGERLPLEFASSEVGAREVEKLIGRIEQGIPL